MARLAPILLLSCIIVCIVNQSECSPAPHVEVDEENLACSLSERRQTPCICCKKDCWYTIAAGATHELGHIPGEAGEQEALATLQLIRQCMIEECTDICMSMRPVFA